MDFFTRYLALRTLLSPLTDLWGHSILVRWEPMISVFPEDCWDFCASLDVSEQFALSQGRFPHTLPAPLRDLVNELSRLLKIPASESNEQIDAPFEEGLSPKKKHELQSILGFLRKQSPSYEWLLDIGGGVGHLARHTAKARQIPTYTLDRDVGFQELGKRQVTRKHWKRALPRDFHFVLGDFPQSLSLLPPIESGVLTLGLHTCGPLAWHHLRLGLRDAAVLNFGCCFDKLDLNSDVQCSESARSHPLPWTKEALFLATRGGKERPFEEFQLQRRVQYYRFALHDFLREEDISGDFMSVGQTAEAIYRQSFSHYVRNRLDHIKCSTIRSDAAIEDFFASREQRLSQQWIASLLRHMLARPLELCLMLDRCLWLEEQGRKPELFEFFDQSLSPRNLGIWLKG